MISMTLSGSVIFIFYNILKLIFKNKAPAYIRYYILKIILLFYILPSSFIFSLFKKNQELKTSLIEVPLNKTIQITSSKIILFNQFNLINLLKYFSFCWFIVVSIFALNIIKQYFIFKKILQLNCKKITLQEQKIFNKLKVQYHVKKDVKLKKSAYIHSPITFGILSPIVILPEVQLQKKEIEMALGHELIHVKHNDLLYKFLFLITLLLHFFNPLCYLLLKEVNKVCEYTCDETYVQNLNSSQKKSYGQLLYKLSTLDYQKSSMFTAAFSHNKKCFLKERIELMLKVNNKKNGKILCIILIILSSLSMGMTTVHACNIIPLIEWDNSIVQSNTVTKGVIYSEEKSNSITGGLYRISNINSIHSYLEDSNGSYIEVKLHTEKANCKHSFTPKKYIKHTIYKDNSCNMDTYNSSICAKCKYIKVGSLEKSTFYAKCPHK